VQGAVEARNANYKRQWLNVDGEAPPPDASPLKVTKFERRHDGGDPALTSRCISAEHDGFHESNDRFPSSDVLFPVNGMLTIAHNAVLV
jgi:hypothetical protein